MTQFEGVREAVHAVHRHFGRIDGLINNAGRSYAAAIEEIEPELFDEIFHLNVLGPIVAMQAVIPLMRAQGGGSIVNINSGTAFMTIPQYSVYSASKRALMGFSLTARAELEKDPIVVSEIYPYITATNFGRSRMGNPAGGGPGRQLRRWRQTRIRRRPRAAGHRRRPGAVFRQRSPTQDGRRRRLASRLTGHRLIRKMAIGKSRRYVVHAIAGRHFVETGDQCGLPARLVSDAIHKIGDTGKKSIDTAIERYYRPTFRCASPMLGFYRRKAQDWPAQSRLHMHRNRISPWKRYSFGQTNCSSDPLELARRVVASGMRPTFLVAMWRGGTPIGIAVQEVLEYHSIHADHIAIRTSSYSGIDTQQKAVRVHAADYLVSRLSAERRAADRR